MLVSKATATSVEPDVGRGGGVHGELSAAETTASGSGGGASGDDAPPDVPCVANGFLSETCRSCINLFCTVLLCFSDLTWFNVAPLLQGTQ